MRTKSDPGIVAAALALLGLGLAILLLSALMARAAWDKVAQEWQPYLDTLTPEQQDRVKSWTKGIRSPHGVPCCDIGDGHRVDYDIRSGGYWIPDPIHLEMPRSWIHVPPEAVVYNAGNPIGEAVVWYVIQGADTVYIRCFVPGGGV